MLKPFICVPCDRVIISKEDVPSLIGLFSKIIVTVPEQIELPVDAASPKDWVVFSQWDPEAGDEQKEYVICTQVLYPEKRQFGEVVKVKLNVEAHKRSQVVVQFNVFPIGQAGEYVVRTWIEEQERVVVGPVDFGIGLKIVRRGAPAVPAAHTPPIE